MALWKGRVATTKLALTRLERRVEQPVRDEYTLYTEGRGRQNATEALRAARQHRMGKGPKRS